MSIFDLAARLAVEVVRAPETLSKALIDTIETTLSVDERDE